jgi:hypothetical protein
MPDQGGRSHLAIQFGGDKFSPEDLGLALSCGWLRIQREKSAGEVTRLSGQLNLGPGQAHQEVRQHVCQWTAVSQSFGAVSCRSVSMLVLKYDVNVDTVEVG